MPQLPEIAIWTRPYSKRKKKPRNYKAEKTSRLMASSKGVGVVLPLPNGNCEAKKDFYDMYWDVVAPIRENAAHGL